MQRKIVWSKVRQAGNAVENVGAYLSERQWGRCERTYSASGDAWSYFHAMTSRGARAYRWGEDGLAGISDDKQLLCFGLALWNARPDPEGAVVRSGEQRGNHGEDVKEYYFYSTRRLRILYEVSVHVSAGGVSV